MFSLVILSELNYFSFNNILIRAYLGTIASVRLLNILFTVEAVTPIPRKPTAKKEKENEIVAIQRWR